VDTANPAAASAPAGVNHVRSPDPGNRTDAGDLRPGRASRISMIRIMQDDIFNARPYIVLSYAAWTQGGAAWTGFVLCPNGSFSQMSVQTMLQLRRT